MTSPEPATSSFSVFVRRMNPPDGPYAIRFEVQGGKGALRMARPGVLIDPPARPRAEESGLTLAQLRTTRFLHVCDGSRNRVGHSLSRIDSVALEALPLGEWVELTAFVELGASYLTLPTEGAAPEEEVDPEDGPTTPRQILVEFRSQVEAAVERPPAPVAAPGAPTPVRAFDPDEPTELPEALREAPAVTPPNLATDPPATMFESPDGGPFEAGVDAWAGVLLHERNTTVVRHLRRRLRELEVRCAELEVQARGARGARS